MLARFAGATLGLLAFAVVTIAGLVVGNPVTVTLSRSILALFVFCIIGTVLGLIAQRVIGEHEQRRVAEIEAHYRDEPAGDAAASDPASPEVAGARDATAQPAAPG